MTLNVLLIVIAIPLVVVAGILAATEAAISRVRASRAQELLDQQRHGAASLLVVAKDPARYVNVLLFLRISFMTTATVLVVNVFVRQWGLTWWSVLGAAVLMATVNYVMVGVAPRTVGRQNPVRVGLATAGFARGLARLLSPLTSALILLGNAIKIGKAHV